jgi:hypothetical protein
MAESPGEGEPIERAAGVAEAIGFAAFFCRLIQHRQADDSILWRKVSRMFLFFGTMLPSRGIRGGRILVISNDQAKIEAPFASWIGRIPMTVTP